MLKKSTLLGLTAAITMSSVVACTPADEPGNQARGYGGADFQQQDGTQQGIQNYGADRHGRVGDAEQNARRYGQTGMYGAQDNDLRGQGQYGGAGGPNDGMMDQGNGGLFGQNRTGDGTIGDGNGRAPLMGDGARNRQGFRDNGGAGGAFDDNGSHRLAQAIEERDDVRNCNVLMHEDDIIVGLETEDGKDGVESKVESEIQEKDFARGKQVHVTDDEDMVRRIGAMEQQSRNGQFGENFVDDIGELIEDIGGALRPNNNN